jgi:hypothetical protein
VNSPNFDAREQEQTPTVSHLVSTNRGTNPTLVLAGMIFEGGDTVDDDFYFHQAPVRREHGIR